MPTHEAEEAVQEEALDLHGKEKVEETSWLDKYGAEDRDCLERNGGVDESKDPRAQEFNRQLMHIARTAKSGLEYDLRYEYLCADYWLTPQLENVFVEPFRAGIELRLPKACPKYSDWIKRYPQWTWLFLSVLGVDEANFTGADRFNRTIILAARAANFWESFSPGFELLRKHYWEEYKPKDLSMDNRNTRWQTYE